MPLCSTCLHTFHDLLGLILDLYAELSGGGQDEDVRTGGSLVGQCGSHQPRDQRQEEGEG